MTRINIIPPQQLTDQHLIAEIKEINQLCGSFKKSLFSRNGIFGIPSKFTLNTNHVKFFYNKGKYLNNRFEELKQEAISRDFNIAAEFNDEWAKNNQSHLFQDWNPDFEDSKIIYQRIKEKIELKPNFYKKSKQKIDDLEYINFLNIKLYGSGK